MSWLSVMLGGETQAQQQAAQDAAMGAADQGLQDIIDMLRPEMEIRQAALGSYQDILSGKTDITQQQGYQQGLQTGQQAVDTSAAARGMQLSGMNIENLAGFGTQYYQQQRNQALGELGGLAGMTQQSQQGITQAMGEQASLPMQAYQMQLAGQQGQQAGLAGMLGGIGGILSGYGAITNPATSDIRLKQNIVYKGTEHGLKMYEFEYKPEVKSVAGSGTYVGVMAQDIMDTHPEAIIIGWNGYMMVDYSKLPVEFKQCRS